MTKCSRILIVLATLLLSLAPAAQAASANSNWLSKAFHHQSKPKVHPERDSFKARERQDKANERTAKQRQRVADKHPAPKDAKTITTKCK
jgi:hypothetical protein